ncbi:MAG: hypothetical protein L0I79_07195, partial [Atopostipes sp.]|nr:hypothetical protein [Atopostipes sp.]
MTASERLLKSRFTNPLLHTAFDDRTYSIDQICRFFRINISSLSQNRPKFCECIQKHFNRAIAKHFISDANSICSLSSPKDRFDCLLLPVFLDKYQKDKVPVILFPSLNSLRTMRAISQHYDINLMEITRKPNEKLGSTAQVPENIDALVGIYSETDQLEKVELYVGELAEEERLSRFVIYNCECLPLINSKSRLRDLINGCSAPTLGLTKKYPLVLENELNDFFNQNQRGEIYSQNDLNYDAELHKVKLNVLNANTGIKLRNNLKASIQNWKEYEVASLDDRCVIYCQHDTIFEVKEILSDYNTIVCDTLQKLFTMVTRSQELAAASHFDEGSIPDIFVVPDNYVVHCEFVKKLVIYYGEFRSMGSLSYECAIQSDKRIDVLSQIASFAEESPFADGKWSKHNKLDLEWARLFMERLFDRDCLWTSLYRFFDGTSDDRNCRMLLSNVR